MPTAIPGIDVVVFTLVPLSCFSTLTGTGHHLGMFPKLINVENHTCIFVFPRALIKLAWLSGMSFLPWESWFRLY